MGLQSICSGRVALSGRHAATIVVYTMYSPNDQTVPYSLGWRHVHAGCRRLGTVAAVGDGGGDVEKNPDLERAKLIGSLVAVAAAVAAVLTWGSDGVQVRSLSWSA